MKNPGTGAVERFCFAPGYTPPPMHRASPPPAPSRRHFLTATTLGAALTFGGGALLSGCGKRAKSGGSASNAKQAAEVLPKHRTLSLLEPDVPGSGPIPDGYLKYPATLVRGVKQKPGSSQRPISAMMPGWGPTPPGLGRNAYLDAVNAALGVPVDPSVQDGMTFSQKLSAILGARDVPELLCAPNWEIDKIPRFAQAVKALFEDLTEHLKGSAVDAYPMLATLPTMAWQYSVWGGRLAAVPYPTDGPFPWAMFYRKDLTDKLGVAPPKTIDELYDFGKKTTKTERGVWAFGACFQMIQMYFKCPGARTGWRKKPGGGLVHKYELPEYKQALEFTRRLHVEGLVHPDMMASNGADGKTLFNGGKMLMTQDGMGAWRGTQSEQSKILADFNVQPLAVFSAVGGDPLAWSEEAPIFYTFVKKGLGKDRTQEILRVLDWLASPLGTEEDQLRQYGAPGKHFTRAPDNSPMQTELGRKEIGNQYNLLGGRMPSVVGTADVPHYVDDLLTYLRATYKFKEPNPFEGLKLEFPPNYSKTIVTTEDKLNDVIRGRRPVSDLDQIVKEWRGAGGDEGRAFFEKALADNGR
jgi:putative aldouronate transport system substrate-binding protein